MFEVYRKEVKFGEEKLTFETGKVARQADGAVIVTYEINDADASGNGPGTGYISYNIISANDPPVYSGGTTFTANLTESADWNVTTTLP